MIDHSTFSALRLGCIFPNEFLESYPYYIEIDPKGDFDNTYLGGQWHEELIDGVQFFYPKRAGQKLGVVELWASGCVIAAAVRDKAPSNSANLIRPWAENANRILESLDLPIRMGSDESAVCALAAGDVLSCGYPDEWYVRYPVVEKGTLSSYSFAVRAPEIYHMAAVIHATEGLMKLEIRRPDLIRLNDREGAYDACNEGMYDEGQE